MRFKKFNPNEYVMVVKKGEVVKEGLGLSVLFNELSTSIMVVPSTAFDGEFAFDELVTSDYQSVCVQGVTTFMITDYTKAAKMLDFAYTPQVKMSDKIFDAVESLENRINNIIKAIVIREVSRKDVRAVLRISDEMAKAIQESLSSDDSISKLGVSVVSVNILGITPRPETRKALEAAAREEILREQDDAIYKRRNAAIEQERIIKENEINTEIAVAEKEKEKEEKEQQMKQYVQKCELDMRMEAEEREQQMKLRAMQAELAMESERQEKEYALREVAVQKKIQIDNQDMAGKIELEKMNKEFTELSAANEKTKADIKAYAAEALVKAYNNINPAILESCAMAQMEPGALMAKAFMNIGENAEKIGSLNMTPDLLQSIVGAMNPNQGFKARR
ncbi:SPFH domain-containing protein [Treponema zioleckii]|uniref:SPFH domain-containing protein n=1 Tax=Treponema zioleckii TaxID=331680 RepID=UPI00168ACC14|nr:SPFH domain-containing protein [Treponema zioleckii]